MAFVFIHLSSQVSSDLNFLFFFDNKELRKRYGSKIFFYLNNLAKNPWLFLAFSPCSLQSLFTGFSELFFLIELQRCCMHRHIDSPCHVSRSKGIIRQTGGKAIKSGRILLRRLLSTVIMDWLSEIDY